MADVDIPCECGSLINDGRLHPVADAGDVMMMMMMHKMLHGPGTSASSHAGRQQWRLFLETRVHSRLHRLVQTEHHLFRFWPDLRPEVERMMKYARDCISSLILLSRLQVDCGNYIIYRALNPDTNRTTNVSGFVMLRIINTYNTLIPKHPGSRPYLRPCGFRYRFDAAKCRKSPISDWTTSATVPVSAAA